MTIPSNVLDAMALTFKTALTDDGQTKVAVRVIDDTQLGDLTEYHTLPAPSILLTGVGFVLTEEQPGAVQLSLIARCLSRLPNKPNDGNIQSRGDVAFNLAAFVVRQLDDGMKYRDAEGAEVETLSRATRVQARNLGARALAVQGQSMWVVSWQQHFQFTDEDLAALLHSFKHLHFTLAQGDENTADILGELELEGATPP